MSTRTARAGGEGSLAEHREEQGRRLRLWAGGLAVVESAVLLVPVYHGFGFGSRSVGWFLALVVGTSAALGALNFWSARKMHEGAPAPAVPKRRDLVSFLSAVVIATAATCWLFDASVFPPPDANERPAWSAKIQKLEDERIVKLKTAGQEPPVAEQDPDVQRLQRQLDEERKELREAEKNVLCEQDGTCGTGIPGEAKAYDDKVKDRDVVAGRVAELSAQLVFVKETARGRAEQTATDVRTARNRVTAIDGELERLRANPPEPRALSSIGEHERGRVILSWIGLLVVFFLLGWRGLRGAASRVYRRSGGQGTLTPQIDEQAAIDDRRRRGAKPYPRDGE